MSELVLIEKRVLRCEKGNSFFWKNLYRCFCGQEFLAEAHKVWGGIRKSCGCMSKNGLDAAMNVRRKMFAEYVLPKEKVCRVHRIETWNFSIGSREKITSRLYSRRMCNAANRPVYPHEMYSVKSN